LLDTKVCRTCGLGKPFSEFDVLYPAMDKWPPYLNYRWQCRGCYHPKLRKQKLPPEDPAALKRWAQNESTYAQHRGSLQPQACERCGSPVEYRVVGHHDNYSEPLNVRWLCYSCHGRYHAEQRTKE
jgi:hypothetical protein